jgi:hypothetical protein
MGGQAKFPIPGASDSSVPGSGGSGFYENILNQQKQAVANVPATQATQATRGMPATRPGQGTEGSQQADTRYLDAYNNYMQRQAGGSQYPPATRSPFGENRPGDTLPGSPSTGGPMPVMEQPDSREQRSFVPGQPQGRPFTDTSFQPQGRPFTDTSFQPQGRPFGALPEQPQQQPQGRRPMEKEKTPSSPKGITMGNGYSNRPLS